MRDFVNPLVLLVVVVLLACRAGGVGDSVTLDGWILALTVTAFIVNGALCMARLLARRRALMSVVWSMGYLILGSCAWVLHGMVQQTADEEQAALLVLKQAWQQGESPYQVDESGDSLFTTAASLGKAELVREVLVGGGAPAEQLAEAARRAAENGRVEVLKLLLTSGTPVNATAGSTTLLCAAAQNGQRKAVELLLQSGPMPIWQMLRALPPSYMPCWPRVLLLSNCSCRPEPILPERMPRGVARLITATQNR